jgi:uncharacterized protein YbaP (TraB family)
MKQLWGFGLFVALATSWGAVGQPTRTSSVGGPALWVVRNGDAAVNLFGRMAVGNDTQWLTPTIEAAFDASDVLWLENPRGDGDRGNELIGRLGFSEGYSLLDALDESDRNRVIRLLERAGMSADALDGRKAWLANLFLSQLIDRMNNVSGSSFPDTILRQRAEMQGKSVFSEWRDIAELVEYSVGLEETIQLQMLGKALDDSESYGARLDAWSRGDLEALSKIADATAIDYPDAHREVNVERNMRWVARIRTMLADDHTEFVAIGIGHLVGPDNLLDQLRAGGLDIQRVN